MPSRSRQLWMLKCWILQIPAKYLSMIYYATSSKQILFSNVKCNKKLVFAIKTVKVRKGWVSISRMPHCNENPTYVFLFWEKRGLSLNFRIHVSMSDLFSPRIGLHTSSSRIGRPIVEIYISLTDARMWKLGPRTRYSFSGNICFEISVFCLCSACIILNGFLVARLVS
jgi:hypothetical protein